MVNSLADGLFAHDEAGHCIPECGLVSPAVIMCLLMEAEASWELTEALAFQSEKTSDLFRVVDPRQ